jgi:hypothetical protein
MEDTLGLTVTRASDKTVSIKFPGTPRAIKLKGALYEHGSIYAEIKAKHQRASFGDEEFSAAKKRLEQLLTIRAVHITDTPKTTIRKERVYGQQSSNRRSTAGSEKANARGGIPPLRASEHSYRTNKHTDVPSGLERNVLQTRKHHQFSSVVDDKRANMAAPNALVSVVLGRTTGNLIKSACICMSRFLAQAPPSTLSALTLNPWC